MACVECAAGGSGVAGGAWLDACCCCAACWKRRWRSAGPCAGVVGAAMRQGGRGAAPGRTVRGLSHCTRRGVREAAVEQPAQRPPSRCLSRCSRGAAPACAPRSRRPRRRGPPCAWRAPCSSRCRSSSSALRATSGRRPMSGSSTRRTGPSPTTCPCPRPRSASRRTPGAWCPLFVRIGHRIALPLLTQPPRPFLTVSQLV